MTDTFVEFEMAAMEIKRKRSFFILLYSVISKITQL